MECSFTGSHRIILWRSVSLLKVWCEGSALSHVQRWKYQLLRDSIYVLHAQNLHTALSRDQGCAVGRHEVADTNAQLLLDQLVSQRQLLFQLPNVVVPLLDMEFGAILLSLEIDLL